MFAFLFNLRQRLRTRKRGGVQRLHPMGESPGQRPPPPGSGYGPTLETGRRASGISGHY